MHTKYTRCFIALNLILCSVFSFNPCEKFIGMELVIQLLSSYQGRDKVIRTCCYASSLLSGFVKDKNAARLVLFSARLAECRVVLRLFDDLPMFMYTYNYGLGKKEKDRTVARLGVASNLCNQVFFPLEHLAWAGDNHILAIKNAGFYRNLSLIAWTSSLLIEIIRGLRIILILNKKRHTMLKRAAADQDQSEQINTEMRRLRKRQFIELIILIQHSADLCNAIHWLPTNYFWSGSLKPWQVGLFGTVSSLIGLCRIMRGM